MDAYLLVDRADIGRIKMQPSSVSHSLPPQPLKHSPSWILKLKNNRDAEMNRPLRELGPNIRRYTYCRKQKSYDVHEISSIINFIWKRIRRQREFKSVWIGFTFDPIFFNKPSYILCLFSVTMLIFFMIFSICYAYMVYTKNLILLILHLLEMTVYNLHVSAFSDKFMKTSFFMKRTEMSEENLYFICSYVRYISYMYIYICTSYIHAT